MADQRPILPLTAGIGSVTPTGIDSGEQAFMNRPEPIMDFLSGIGNFLKGSGKVARATGDDDFSFLLGPEGRKLFDVSAAGLTPATTGFGPPAYDFGAPTDDLDIFNFFGQSETRGTREGAPEQLGQPRAEIISSSTELDSNGVTADAEAVRAAEVSGVGAQPDITTDVEIAGAETPVEEGSTPQEQGFASAMQQYIDALGQKADVGSIDEYKKIFTDATGIDASGKVDNRTALMAFGLALMQNKAGKGFNVGEILKATGEAGEAALPAMEAARKEARAGQLAAGKFALEERSKDIATANARLTKITDRIAALQDKAYDRDTQLIVERLKGQAKLEEQRLKQLGENQRASIKSQQDAGKLGEPKSLVYFSDPSGNKDFKIQGQQVGTSGVFSMNTDPQSELNMINDSLAEARGAVATTQGMLELSEAHQIGGYEGMYNALSSMLQPLGIDIGGKPESVQEYKAGVKKLLTQHRKLLTGGEAGNAISDRDVQIILQSLGMPDTVENPFSWLMNNPNQASAYMRSLNDLFKRRVNTATRRKEAFIAWGQKNAPQDFMNLTDIADSPEETSALQNKDFGDDLMWAAPTVIDGVITLKLK